MRYLIVFLKILLCYVCSIVLTGLALFFVFRFSFTDINLKRYARNEHLINVQKDKIQQDLATVISANNIDPFLFEGIVSDEIVIKNNEQYIQGFYDYILSRSDAFPFTTQAADEFESRIKQILLSYGDKIDPDRYVITETGINSFAALEKSSFYYSAVPILGFETAANYIRKLFAMERIILAAAILCLLFSFTFMLFLGKSKKLVSSSFILYSVCASGILLSLISGYGIWIISSKNSILSTSYLKDIGLLYFNRSIAVGILMFLISQILLFVLSVINKRNENRFSASLEQGRDEEDDGTADRP